MIFAKRSPTLAAGTCLMQGTRLHINIAITKNLKGKNKPFDLIRLRQRSKGHDRVTSGLENTLNCFQ
jgi:hypothetical protein